jgi:hypothetical protein
MNMNMNMNMNMPAGPERPRPVRQGWSDGALFASQAPTHFPPTSTAFTSSPQFNSDAIPSVPQGMAPVVESQFIQPTPMGLPPSLQMTPLPMHQRAPSNTAGIFGPRAPPPPATTSLPQSAQLPAQGTQFPPQVTPTAILAPDGSRIELIPPPIEHPPFDPALEAPMAPLRRPEQQAQIPRAGSEDVDGELAGPGGGSSKSRSFADEASKYVQLQFSMTQRHGQACNLCKVSKFYETCLRISQN